MIYFPEEMKAFWIIRSVIFCIVITSIEASYSIDKTEVNLGQTKYKVKTQKYKLWKDTTYNSANVTWPHLFPEACNTTLIECGRLCFNTTGWQVEWQRCWHLRMGLDYR